MGFDDFFIDFKHAGLRNEPHAFLLLKGYHDAIQTHLLTRARSMKKMTVARTLGASLALCANNGSTHHIA